MALIWGGFSVTLVFVMLCLNTLLLRNWVEEAKRVYPLVQLPLEMTSPRRTIFADRLFWIALALAFIVDALNGPHEIWPSIPSLLGAVGGIAALIVFCLQATMTLLPALGFILLYLPISVAIARIRAGLGSPVHDLHFIGPQVMLTEVFGASALGKRHLIMFGFFHSITRAHRSHPMPHQIEGMKLAGESHTSQRGLTVAMMLAVACALLLGWGVLLDAFFRYGGSGWSGRGREAWSLVDQWLTGPGTPNPYSWGALVWGMAFTMLLTWLRTRYVWWLLHPAGFAVSGSWSMALFAPSVLVGWLAKTLILHYGGMSAYAPASAFFMGLTMGEFTAGTGWGIAEIALQRRMYNFLP